MTPNTSSSGASGNNTVQSLMIDVRASTQGFSQDITTIRSSLDSTLLPGFTQAGDALDIRRGRDLQVPRGRRRQDDP